LRVASLRRHFVGLDNALVAESRLQLPMGLLI
jgi:hypothetical protein